MIVGDVDNTNLSDTYVDQVPTPADSVDIVAAFE